jgi:hypothetical protein
MNWQELLHIDLFGKSGAFLQVEVGPIFIAGFIVMSILLFRSRRSWRSIFNTWKVEEANIKLGELGDVKIKPDYLDMQIAHKAWVELSTRKAGLAFDEEHDVITEVYDSWYKLFGEMRELVKQIPSDKIRTSEDTRKLVFLLVDALNKGLRPHLTKWQSRFRSWYEHESNTNQYRGKSPQEIQQHYPKYDELVKELKVVNQQMVEYTGFIKKLAHGDIEEDAI